MALDQAFLLHLQQLLRQKALIGENTVIREVTRIYGGYINRTYRLTSTETSFFVKVNSAPHFPHMFASEAAGLQLLADSRTVSIPAVIAHGQWEDLTFLLMEWIEPGQENAGTFQLLGHQLAEMHRHSALRFGLDRDHTAWLTQSNTFHDNWADFFIEERMQPTLRLAMEKGYLDTNDLHSFEKLYPRVAELFPDEPPALLHGDLWKGNCLTAADGRPYLIDPVVYYGHREMDIAMTLLFGGFDETFYSEYNSHFPLAPGWKDRMDLCNLYPLLILTVLGPDYRDQLRTSLGKYI